LPFPAPPHYFLTKDAVSDYLETYAARFELPVRRGVRVERLTKENERYVVNAGTRRFQAKNVVAAIGSFQIPWALLYAQELYPSII
jgi:putative flavoprotein involved in K+ transport